MNGCEQVAQTMLVQDMMKKNNYLSALGFNMGLGGAHISRTMMLEELSILLAHTSRIDAEKKEYLHAIIAENCLGKRSAKTRTLTGRYLVDLYSLDYKNILFRALLYFWNRDTASRPLLALLCAYARDPVLRVTAHHILNISEGTVLARESLEEFIDAQKPGRFSKATLKSTAQNINATWTKSGHLSGRAKKVRGRATPTAASVSYAMFLGYLTGLRGQTLIQSEYGKLLDCPPGKIIELAEEASRKGWIDLKRVGEIIEIGFPKLISQHELELLHEQD